MPRTDAAFGAAKAAGQGGPVPAFVQKFAGLAGQTADALTCGAWTTRTVSQEDYDPSSIVSLSANVFTLGAGSYIIDATVEHNYQPPGAGAYFNYGQARVRNTTTSTTVLIGTGNMIATASASQRDVYFSRCFGLVTCTASNAFEVQHYANFQGCAGTFAGGNSGGSAIGERFVKVNIMQIA